MSPVFRHGALRLYLLKLLEEQPRHGYDVISLLEDRFMGLYAPSAGTVYPRLARLEAEGLVTHDEADGRKTYRLTDAGREELRRNVDAVRDLERDISRSVAQMAKDVRAEVRTSVRELREELKTAAREVRREARVQGRIDDEHVQRLARELDALRRDALALARVTSAEHVESARAELLRLKAGLLDALRP